MEVQFGEIIPEKRFAAGKVDGQHSNLRCLVENILPFIGGEFPGDGSGVVSWEVDITVNTIVVAPFGKFDDKRGQKRLPSLE